MSETVGSETLRLLDRLIRFETVSRTPNAALIDFVAGELAGVGIRPEILPANDGRNANLYATVGPRDAGGVLLSGHTDVVPVTGQSWTVPCFEMTRRDGRVYGRGSADMKGFVASALAAARRAAGRRLATPLHLAFSFDEEIGCVGVRSLLDMLEQAPFRPRFGIVGEPTGMAVATGHKGKTACRGVFRGREAHSALAPTGVNAIHMASDFIQGLRETQAALAAGGHHDGDYDVPYTTVHVGTITGGVALNIVPNHAAIDFEIRNVAPDDPDEILRGLRERAAAIVALARGTAPEADIELEVVNSYPGLATPASAEVVDFVKRLTGRNTVTKVSFGTEGGLFSTRLAMPVVVCGPGSMAQGHKPDEYVTEDQLARCDAMLDRLLDRLAAGL